MGDIPQKTKYKFEVSIWRGEEKKIEQIYYFYAVKYIISSNIMLRIQK